MPAFIQGLKEAGFVEGKNISIEIRRADGHYDRLPSLAAELVGRDAAAIFATDVPSAFAAKAATKTIPIVFVIGADPVKVGLVDSLSRPKGNLTGMSVFSVSWDQSAWSCWPSGHGKSCPGLTLWQPPDSIAVKNHRDQVQPIKWLFPATFPVRLFWVKPQ
jgi:ABC transporter substrate binding protein